MNDQQKTAVIKDFVLYAKEQLGIDQLPKIKLVTDQKFAVTLRSFGAYKPETRELDVYIANRNAADILRTIAHELVHHRQNELGMLQPESGETGSPHENQANSLAGELLRHYGKQHEIIYERVLARKKLIK